MGVLNTLFYIVLFRLLSQITTLYDTIHNSLTYFQQNIILHIKNINNHHSISYNFMSYLWIILEQNNFYKIQLSYLLFFEIINKRIFI